MAIRIAVLIAAFLLALMWLDLALNVSNSQGISAGGGIEVIITRDADGPPGQCALNPNAWQCRPCDKDGNLGYGGCWCRFCVNAATKKTVESANDLREIACPKPGT